MWKCDGCGRAGLWGPGWCWFGSLADWDQEGRNGIKVACGPRCRAVIRPSRTFISKPEGRAMSNQTFTEKEVLKLMAEAAVEGYRHGLTAQRLGDDWVTPVEQTMAALLKGALSVKAKKR